MAVPGLAPSVSQHKMMKLGCRDDKILDSKITITIFFTEEVIILAPRGGIKFTVYSETIPDGRKGGYDYMHGLTRLIGLFTFSVNQNRKYPSNCCRKHSQV